jgi:YVTN family beta-propeller protein
MRNKNNTPVNCWAVNHHIPRTMKAKDIKMDHAGAKGFTLVELMMRIVKSQRRFASLIGPAIFAMCCLATDDWSGAAANQQVGPLPSGGQTLPSTQILRMAGRRLEFSGRPVDLALSPDRKTIFVKNMKNLLVVNTASWTLSQTLDYPGSGASLHGIAVSHDGSRVYVTGSVNELYEWQVADNEVVSFSRTIALPQSSDPCGLALSADGTKAYVCLSMKNALAVVDLAGGTVSRQSGVGIAPWNVCLSPDGATAYLSDWGGRFPSGTDLTANSAGTQVVVDSRGVASSGVVSFVNLATGVESAQMPTGLHPSDLVLSHDGHTLFVANANSDTVTAIDTQTRATRETILIRPDPALPFGSESDGLAISSDGTTLFVASAGNNAVAVVRLSDARHARSRVEGFFPTDWYPGAVVVDKSFAYVANIKGLGSRDGQPRAASYRSSDYLGTVDCIPIPRGGALKKSTALVVENARIAQIKRATQPARASQSPAPVPVRVGEASVFKHVLYILKENKTYDQVFGDLPQGNGSSKLCIYPRSITPNHHALALQYVLLDNYYCNGVNSADGHSWSTEGNTTDHLEKSFGGFVRSYTFGDDPLTYSSTGFIWNNVLQHGLSFRNYGEFDYASVPSGASWLQIYTDFTNGSHSIAFAQNIGLASLRPYSSTNVPGWDLNIPDVVRAYGFIKELGAAQKADTWAAFHFLYLPNDHTGGQPSPQAQVADNDVSLGRVVEAVTKSAFASNTVIFVVEDDPQSGYDHVDGHRSLCLVISPYTKRAQTVSTFYNQAGVLHTMEQILGLPPMNQQDAMAPLMSDCFCNTPDFTPYTALPNNIDLVSGGRTRLSSKARYYERKVQKMDFTRPDRIDEDTFNRYIWHCVKGNNRYPSEFVGGHGKGLEKLGLVLVNSSRDDDD